MVSADDGEAPGSGRLIVCGSPLGNLGDATGRLRSALAEVDIVAAEDTRRLRRLARDLGITVSGRIVSYYDAIERRRTDELVAALAAGSSVALISDAGMPGVSDPGYRLVSACHAAGIPVTVIPGPSAAVSALAVSGLPSDRFAFEGFLPRKSGQRAARIAELAAEPRTLVLFESPRRAADLVAELSEAFGADRPATLCRELTKVHEEVLPGTLGSLATELGARTVLGEITLVIGGAVTSGEAPAPAELAARVRALEESGMDRKSAMRAVAQQAGVPRRSVFDALVESPQFPDGR